MSRRWGRAALCAVLVIAALPVLALPAAADDPADGYTSWQAKDQQHNHMAPAGAYTPTIDQVTLPYRDDPNYVDVSGHDGDTQWEFSLEGDDDQPLEVGRTYVADAAHPFFSPSQPDSAALVANDSCDTRVGSFTVHELAIDETDSTVQRLSVSYSLGCMDANTDPSAPLVDTNVNSVATGSIAFHASSPPAAAQEPPGGLPTGTVAGVWAGYDIAEYSLHWADPVDADWADTIVCGTPGLKPLAAPGYWCLQDNARTAGDDWGNVTAVSGWTISLWPRYRDGHLGRRTSFTVRGSIVSLETDPASAAATTGLHLHGTVLDGPSHGPVPGRFVDVFLTRVWPNLADSPDGGRREDKVAARLRTDANGNYGATFPLRPGWQYQARFDGNGVRDGNLSQLVPADGSSYIDLDDTRAAGGRSSQVALTARVSSVHHGDKVLFQRLVKRHWRKVVVRKVGTHGVAVTRTHVTGKTGKTYRAVLIPVGNGPRRASVPLRVQLG